MPNDDTKTFGWLKNRVDRLFNSADMTAYRKIQRDNWLALTMQAGSEIPLPEYVTKRAGGSFDLPSELILKTSNALINAVAAYPYFVSVVPTPGEGNPTAKHEEQGDKIERHATLARMKADEADRISSAVTFDQVNSCFACAVAKCLPPPKGEDRKKPFTHMTIDTPAPDTVAFKVQNGGTFRPAEFAMRYKVEARWVEEEYANFDGSALTPIFKKGKLSLVPLEAGRADMDADWSTGYQPGVNEAKQGATYLVDFYYHDDGQTIRHGVGNAGQEQGGQIVYEAPNPIGRVMAYVVPGTATNLRQPGKQMLSVLEELYVNQKSVSFIFSYLMTVAVSNDPDVLINMSPDQIKAWKGEGLIRPASTMEIDGAGPYLLNVPGDAKPWVKTPPEGVKIVLEAKRQDGMALAQVWQPIIDKEILAQSTYGAVALGTEAQESAKTSLLKHKAAMWSLWLRDYLDSAGTYNDVAPMRIYAVTEVKRGRGDPIGAGQYTELKRSDLEGFEYDVSVAIRQVTKAQEAMEMDRGKWEEDNGYTSHRQVMAIKYPDVTAQHEEMVRDRGRKVLAPAMVALLGMKTEARVLTELGLRPKQGMVAAAITQQLMPPQGPQQQPPGTAGFSDPMQQAGPTNGAEAMATAHA